MIAIVLIAVALLYAAFGLVLYLLQSRFIYFPDRAIGVTPADAGMDYEDVTFRAADGVALAGWYVPAPPRRRRAVVLYCHGNAGNISHRVPTVRLMHDLGLGVLIFDYRGYGHSAGQPDEQGTYVDADAAWTYLTERRQVPPEDIVVFGRSLGGAVAAHLAERRRPAAAVLESTFTSIPDVAARTYFMYPVRTLSKFHYDTRDRMSRITCPVFVVHSRDDEMIPFEHGRRIYEAANEPKRFLELRGGHNEAFLDAGRRYAEALSEFIGEHAGRPDRPAQDPSP